MIVVYEADPHDPTDDIEEPAAHVDNPDDTTPVELVETTPDHASTPPDEWASELTDDDWDERFDGVHVTAEPDDGTPG